MKEPGVIDIINRNKSVLKPCSEIVGQALLNLHTQATNTDPFAQQENDVAQSETSTVINNLSDKDENHGDDAMVLGEQVKLIVYTALIIINKKMRSLNKKERELFDIVLSWAKCSAINRLVSHASVTEPFRIFLTGSAGWKSFLMKIMYQVLTWIISFESVSVDKPKVLFMAIIGVATINIDGTIIHFTLNITVGKTGKRFTTFH